MAKREPRQFLGSLLHIKKNFGLERKQRTSISKWACLRDTDFTMPSCIDDGRILIDQTPPLSEVGYQLYKLLPRQAEETDPCAKVFGIAGNLDQRFSAETHQQRVDELIVLQCKQCQEARHRENQNEKSGSIPLSHRFLTRDRNSV